MTCSVVLRSERGRLPLLWLSGIYRLHKAAQVKLQCIYISYYQRDATNTIFFIIISVLHVSGGFSAHHQELIKQYVQPWLLSCFSEFQPNHTSGRQQETITIPKAAHTVLLPPDDGRKNGPKHVEH